MRLFAALLGSVPALVLGAASALVLGACGGAQAVPTATASAAPAPADDAAPTAAPSAGPGAPDPAPAAPSALPLPTACADASAEICTPSPAFVERLCTRQHQDAALALFASGTPFARMYLRGKVDELAFDEEVLVLRFHAVPKGGIQVGSGTGSYDVLRWDGTCSKAVEAEMLTRAKPPRPRTAHLQWHRMGDKTQTALIAASEAVKRAHAKRGKECQGAMSGDVSSSCEKADAVLVEAVVEYVRAGGSMPAPDAL